MGHGGAGLPRGVLRLGHGMSKSSHAAGGAWHGQDRGVLGEASGGSSQGR